jgi:hypothetical protein
LYSYHAPRCFGTRETIPSEITQRGNFPIILIYVYELEPELELEPAPELELELELELAPPLLLPSLICS